MRGGSNDDSVEGVSSLVFVEVGSAGSSVCVAFGHDSTASVEIRVLLRGADRNRGGGHPLLLSVLPRPASAILGVRRYSAVAERVPLGRGRLNLCMDLDIDPVTRSIELELRLHNPARARHSGGHWDLGDPGSILLGLVRVDLTIGESHLARLDVGDSELTEGASAVGPVGSVLVQHSSGGPNWHSTTHVNSDNEVLHRRCGWVLEVDGIERASGARASPRARFFRGERVVSVMPENFWQRFPCAFSLRADGCSLDYVADGVAGPTELQAGERLSQRIRFVEEHAATATVHDQHVPTWLAGPNEPAIGEGLLLGRMVRCDHPFDFALQELLLSPREWLDRREAIDQYGWRHHGEVFADHESLYVADDLPPLVSHYNNQYDVLLGFCMTHLRTGEGEWLVLAHDLAKHCADIDVYRTCEDRHEYNGGLFWHTEHYVDAATSTHRTWSRRNADGTAHGGGPAEEHCYVSGLCLHASLCAEEESLNTARLLAEWIHRHYESDPTVVGTFYDAMREVRGAGRAKRLVFNRGTGNYVATLLDLAEATGESVWMERAESALRRTIGPEDDVESRHLLNIEINWSYTILLQAIVRFMQYRIEVGSTDSYVAELGFSLVRYLRWMADNERPYLERRSELEYPNATWISQDVRKHNLMMAGAYLDPAHREKYERSASMFAAHVVDGLAASPERRFTRVQAILMWNIGLASATPRLAVLAGLIAGREAEPVERLTEEAAPSAGLRARLLDVLRKGTSLRDEWHWIRARLLR